MRRMCTKTSRLCAKWPSQPIELNERELPSKARKIYWLVTVNGVYAARKFKWKPCSTSRKDLLHPLKIHKAMTTADTRCTTAINGLHCIRIEQASRRNPLTFVRTGRANHAPSPRHSRQMASTNRVAFHARFPHRCGRQTPVAKRMTCSQVGTTAYGVGGGVELPSGSGKLSTRGAERLHGA